jgi:hypothetical protein
MSLDLKRILADEEDLQNVAYWPGAVRYCVTTPAFRGFYVVGPIAATGHFLLITAKDRFDDGLCRALLTFIATRDEAFPPDREVSIREGFHHEGYPFDAVLLLRGSCQGMYETVNKTLDRRTVAAIPIMRYEFSGNESSKDVAQIRHYGPDTINWTRTPQPFVLIRSRNDKWQTRYGSDRRPSYESESEILDQLLNLPEDRSSFVEVENFLGQHCRIVVRRRKFAIAFGDRQVYVKKVKLGPEQLVVAKADIERWIHDFLTRGLPPSPT